MKSDSFAAKEEPVFVFFNGGPGASSMGLYTFGTGPLEGTSG